MLYQGDSVPGNDGSIEFNKVNYINRVGWATYPDRVFLWDSTSGKVSDFTTRFIFTIDTQQSPSYGHGLAFFLAPVGFEIPPNSAGGFLGLFNTTTMTLSPNPVVMVEFDTFPNVLEGWDPPVQHVGINNNISSAVYTPWNASIHSADNIDVWITYNSSAKNLSVSWLFQYSANARENTSLSYIIDLTKVLPNWVTIGLSAATGAYVERHILQFWQFNSSLVPTKEEQLGGGRKTSSHKAKTIVGIAIPSCALIAGMIAAFLILRKRAKLNGQRRKKDETMTLTSINEDLERGAGPRRFSYDDLASATSNFSEERKLGEGGFGAVYKGHLKDGNTAVAVKRISRGSRQGKKEYITEVKTISQLRHRNLVQLIGWCHDKGVFMLVYEFMPNGSLDSHLFGDQVTLLPWALRYKISIGLASALLYLHEEWEQCVVHRDVKPSNVMLDSSFNVKLGDFGLARLMDHELGPRTTGLAGTFGYLAPEYVRRGRASKESDVYSFGVVALEIATGRKASDTFEEKSEVSLVEWIWDLYGCGNLPLAVDTKLESEYDGRQIECLMVVGLWCAHPDHSLRPSIRQAIHVLCFEAPLPDLPPKMPVPVFHVPALVPANSSGSSENTTASSILEGR
ncbi:hypothetical protein Tsubulata_016492 [Turnera subulata]|uniref:Protein kinase domain-containing protein n=1 Tax=Turnera subulata TaxID=218843 RepID=A0A9Q0J1Y6_9ROSI|nr:hypothetical protein Tsubulata_016492 [Turnera subulata]